MVTIREDARHQPLVYARRSVRVAPYVPALVVALLGGGVTYHATVLVRASEDDHAVFAQEAYAFLRSLNTSFAAPVDAVSTVARTLERHRGEERRAAAELLGRIPVPGIDAIAYVEVTRGDGGDLVVGESSALASVALPPGALRAAAKVARDEGDLVRTEGFAAAAARDAPSVALVAPVYDDPAARSDPARRAAALAGVVVALLPLRPRVAAAYAGTNFKNEAEIAIVDGVVDLEIGARNPVLYEETSGALRRSLEPEQAGGMLISGQLDWGARSDAIVLHGGPWHIDRTRSIMTAVLGALVTLATAAAFASLGALVSLRRRVGELERAAGARRER